MSFQQRSARTVAVDFLCQIMENGRLLSELTSDGAFQALAPADRARAQRLTLETLRGVERADRLLQPFLQKKPHIRVHNILRLGTVELAMGGDAHGVVNEAVAMTGANKRTQSMKGLVNAVLRKVAATAPEKWQHLRAPRLPVWLRNPLVAAYGSDVLPLIEAAHFAGAPIDLTAKSDPEAVAKATGGIITPSGSVRLQGQVQVSALAGYDSGEWWVQDAAAAMPARLIADRVRDKDVLDMCAAPGGKTLQLAAAGARVTSIDSSANRMARVQENLTRTRLSAEVQVTDALRFIKNGFDAIILDAPCSATGTIRRHPDLPFAKDGSEFGALIDMQGRMLRHATRLLKAGGTLVYCTCSLLPDEGECQIEDLLAADKTMQIDREALNKPFVDPAWISAEGGLRLRPDYWSDIGGMDGFYIAVLRKQA